MDRTNVQDENELFGGTNLLYKLKKIREEKTDKELEAMIQASRTKIIMQQYYRPRSPEPKPPPQFIVDDLDTSKKKRKSKLDRLKKSKVRLVTDPFEAHRRREKSLVI